MKKSIDLLNGNMCISVLYSCKLSDVRSHKQHLVDYSRVMKKMPRDRLAWKSKFFSKSSEHKRQEDLCEEVAFRNTSPKQEGRGHLHKGLRYVEIYINHK